MAGELGVAGVPNVGDVLAGKYRVEKVIGVGGMGVVLSAMHLHLDERVAIKLILQAANNPDTVARFIREGKSAVKIRSEHVARVLDVGTLDTGAPYMVMEFLEGNDLLKVLQERGPMPIPVAIGHILQACEALAEAHAMGIVHRDLKPANLFLSTRADGSPCVKVLDFGISKASSGTVPDAAMTKTSTVMGSPLYMSPEQMRSSRDVDARADIWALGTIVHELLVGAPPFSATTMPELCARILQDPPPPLRQVRGDVPAALEAAVQRSLEKDPAHRFANVAEFAAAIVEFGPPEGRTSLERVARVLRVSNLAASSPAHGPVGVSRMASTSTPTPALGASGMRSTESTWSETSSGKRGMPVGLVLAGVLAVAMVGALAIVGVFAFRRSHAKVETTVVASEPAATSLASVQAPVVPVVPVADPVVADAAVAAPSASTTSSKAIAAVTPTSAPKLPPVQPKVTPAQPKVTPTAAASSARAPAMGDRKW